MGSVLKLKIFKISTTKNFAKGSVKVVIASSMNLKEIENGSIDVAFANNFFEHLSKEDVVKTIREVYRVLRCGGVMILQPNIRFCFKDYWMFFDRITPLDDRSLPEVLDGNRLKVVECKPRFLPYTTKSKLPKSIFYLNFILSFHLHGEYLANKLLFM
ncbi:MAG: hypothetical protein DRQ06_02655 [Candidatus Hydrothermota bacterium]|nr:MAG: hypothetical protein DRQ06_02655 [Candidatus Hydrothermae bacterium]